MNFTKNDFNNGKKLIFQTKDQDDLREAELRYSTFRGTFLWAIWFNGQLIGTWNSFKCMKVRFEKLKEKWGLEFNRTENE